MRARVRRRERRLGLRRCNVVVRVGHRLARVGVGARGAALEVAARLAERVEARLEPPHDVEERLDLGEVGPRAPPPQPPRARLGPCRIRALTRRLAVPRERERDALGRASARASRGGAAALPPAPLRASATSGFARGMGASGSRFARSFSVVVCFSRPSAMHGVIEIGGLLDVRLEDRHLLARLLVQYPVPLGERNDRGRHARLEPLEAAAVGGRGRAGTAASSSRSGSPRSGPSSSREMISGRRARARAEAGLGDRVDRQQHLRDRDHLVGVHAVVDAAVVRGPRAGDADARAGRSQAAAARPACAITLGSARSSAAPTARISALGTS